jgi:hypothetical protein
VEANAWSAGTGGHLARFDAVAHGCAVGIVAALGANQPSDVGGQHGLKDLQAGAHGQGQQPLTGGAGQLGTRQGHLLGQLQLRVVSRGGAVGILRHGGPLLVELLGGCPTPTTRQVSGGDRHLNFYGNRDILDPVWDEVLRSASLPEPEQSL